MKKMNAIAVGLLAAVVMAFGTKGMLQSEADRQQASAVINLPESDRRGEMSVERALSNRRSVRDFAAKPLMVRQLSQLLWAAQGVTDKRGLRTAPSAGALYPLELYVVARDVTGLAPGIYKYSPDSHRLTLLNGNNKIKELSMAAVNQSWMADAAVVIAIAGVYDRTSVKYGDRAPRYVHIETGCAAENIYLQATALGLGTTLVGAFDDNKVAEVLGLKAYEYPLGLMPLGYPPK